MRKEVCKCPVCQGSLSVARKGLDDLSPRPGDYTVCVGCSCALRFSDSANLVIASTDEMIQDLGSSGLRLIHMTQRAIMQLQGTNP